MKITKGGLFSGLISTAADSGSIGGVHADNDPTQSGQALISLGSNSATWQAVVSTITSNGSNTLLGPHVNFASGSNVTFSVASNTLTIHSTGAGAGTFLEITNGGGGTVQAHGNLGSTETIDTANGNYHWGTLDANCTLTFTTTADTKERWFTLELIENGTGGYTPTWPGSVVWLGGSTPTHTTTAGTTTIYVFFTRNGGTTWIGGQLGGGGPSVGTTATDVAGASSGGSASTISKSDHAHLGVVLITSNGSNALLRPIANFASGSNMVFSVASNTLTLHASLTNEYAQSFGRWELLMQDGVTSPPVPLETEDGSDWLYGWVPG